MPDAAARPASAPTASRGSATSTCRGSTTSATPTSSPRSTTRRRCGCCGCSTSRPGRGAARARGVARRARRRSCRCSASPRSATCWRRSRPRATTSSDGDDVLLTCFTDSAGAVPHAPRRADGRARRLRASAQAEIDLERYLLGATTDHLEELTLPRPQGDPQPQVLHLGRAAGQDRRGAQRAVVAVVLDRPAGAAAGVGRGDRGVQQRHRGSGLGARGPGRGTVMTAQRGSEALAGARRYETRDRALPARDDRDPRRERPRARALRARQGRVRSARFRRRAVRRPRQRRRPRRRRAARDPDGRSHRLRRHRRPGRRGRTTRSPGSSRTAGCTGAAPWTSCPRSRAWRTAPSILLERGLPPGVQLVLVASVMEEDCDGYPLMHLIEDEGVRPDVVVLGEPTNLDVYRGHRGRMAIEVVDQGRLRPRRPLRARRQRGLQDGADRRRHRGAQRAAAQRRLPRQGHRDGVVHRLQDRRRSTRCRTRRGSCSTAG